MMDFLEDLLSNLADDLPMWILVPFLVVIWLIIGAILITFQFLLAGWPVGWLSWSAAGLLALFAPIQVAILIILVWIIASGDYNELIPTFTVWMLWPFTPAIIDTISNWCRSFQQPLISDLLFAWRYESVWIVLITIVFFPGTWLWWTERHH